jgi:hypothetical protein
MSETENNLRAAVENAAAKVAAAETIDEATAWQGIANQSLYALQQLAEPVEADGVNLSDEN